MFAAASDGPLGSSTWRGRLRGSGTRPSGSTARAASASTSTRSCTATRSALRSSSSRSVSTRSSSRTATATTWATRSTLAQAFQCPVIAQVELRGWLARQGRRRECGRGDQQGRHRRKSAGIKVTLTNAYHSSRAARRRHLRGRGVRPGGRARGRLQALLRRRHVRVRRHAADRAHLRARRRRPAHRRPLHDGSARGGGRARAARRRTLCPLPLRHVRAAAGTPAQLRELAPAVEVIAPEPGGTVEL